MATPTKGNGDAYWNATLRLLVTVLVIWAAVSYVAGILLADVLNGISLGGYQLGFWFAQQGSIFVFVGLIFWYAHRMNKIDEQHDVHED